MRRKTIFPIDWVKCHPYKQAKETDTYYAHLADRVFNVIYGSEISYFFDDEREPIAHIAVRLTMYLEDLVSETGVWKAALAEFKKRYGVPLPFHELGDDYEEGFVNKEEVRFLLWNEMQTYDGNDSFINPENPAITAVADDVFYLLDEAWETAPENDRLHDFLHNEAAVQSYWEARTILEWFSQYSFVSCSASFGKSIDSVSCSISGKDLPSKIFASKNALAHSSIDTTELYSHKLGCNNGTHRATSK